MRARNSDARNKQYYTFMGILYRLAWALLIIQSGQSRAKVGNKLRVPTPLLCLNTDFWELVSTITNKYEFAI